MIRFALVLLIVGVVCGVDEQGDGFGQPGVSKEGEPKAEPYIFHPQENEMLEAAAQGAARLVSAGLSGASGDTQVTRDLISKLLTLLGFDTSKLSAIAVNAILFIAQLIGTALISPKSPRSEPPSGDPSSWIFENSPVEARELVKEATERTLPEKLIEAVRDSSRLDTDCVELLLCQGAPILWGMQRGLVQEPKATQWKAMSPVERMYSNFPALQQVADQAAACDVRFPACRIKYGNDLK